MSVCTAFAFLIIFSPPMFSSFGVLFPLVTAPLPFLLQSLLRQPISICCAEFAHNRMHMRSHSVRIASQLAHDPIVVVWDSAIW